ncbi:hypothetical protein HMPREF3291_08890 [Bacillus sp. HMSC76G11]|nr:hypothetical protein HMPREF3291_08890 [Bacillus sp. HMSC76G11]
MAVKADINSKLCTKTSACVVCFSFFKIRIQKGNNNKKAAIIGCFPFDLFLSVCRIAASRTGPYEL